MNACRVLLVCPQFWPGSEPRSLLATGFAEALADSKHIVTVVTRHLVGFWPFTFKMGFINVVRLSQRSTRLIDSVRNLGGGDPWIRELNQWLPANRNQFDFAIVIAGDSEIASIAQVLKRWEVKSVVRIENLRAPEPQPVFTKRDPMLIFASPDDVRGSRTQVFGIADGSDSAVIPIDCRESVRRALGKAHPMLDIPGTGPLALCSSPLEKRHGVFELVSAWRSLLKTCSTARLWLVGTGIDGYQLFRHVKDLEIEHAVIMPGSVDHARDLVLAADVIVLPGLETFTHDYVDFFALTAIEHQLPIICHSSHRAVRLRQSQTAHRGSESSLGTGDLWTFCEPGDPLASVIREWSESRPKWNSHSRQGLNVSANSMTQMALRYIEFGQTMLQTIGEHNRNSGAGQAGSTFTT